MLMITRGSLAICRSLPAGGHGADVEVTAASLDPSCERVYTGASDGTVKVHPYHTVVCKTKADLIPPWIAPIPS